MKHGVPDLYWAHDFKDWDIHAAGPTGVYVMARPLGYQGLCLRRRLKLAWAVFLGHYDVVRWQKPL